MGSSPPPWRDRSLTPASASTAESMKHLPFTSAGGRDRISTAASAMISGLRDRAAILSPSARLVTAAVAIYVSGHRQANPSPASAYSAAQPSDSSVIPYFDRV